MSDNARPIIRPGEMPEGRRDRIEVLLGEARILGTMEDTFEYHGVRYLAALTLATLEMADALTDIAAAIERRASEALLEEKP